MKTLKRWHLIITISFMLFQVILACRSWKTTPSIITSTQYPSPTASSAPQTNSAIPSPKPTQTIITIPTSSATSTLTPAAPTWTPQPTLSADEAKSYVMDLLQNNGGCKLPCWWGITPGLTTWLEAKTFLQRFAIDISIKEKSSNLQIAYVQIPSPVDVPNITYLNQEYGIRNGIVETIQTYNFELTNWYYLINVLNNFGLPEEVGIFTFRNEFNGSQPTGIVLFYPSSGILIDYVGHKKVETIGDYVKICPGGTYNFLYLWSPEKKMTFDDAVRTFMDVKNLPYPLQLEEATGMDLKTFYDTFRDPNTTTCLETPKQLWPEQ